MLENKIEKNNKAEIISPQAIHQVAKEHGWWDRERSIPELLCLIHSEISEALEGCREHLTEGEDGWLGEELADAIIRIFDLCEHEDINILSEVEKKHNKNKKRKYRHGNKKF